jgi:hypothetical protein
MLSKDSLMNEPEPQSGGFRLLVQVIALPFYTAVLEILKGVREENVDGLRDKKR